MSLDPVLDPSELVLPSGTVHLAVGGEGPFLRTHLDALAQYGHHKSGGFAGRRNFDERVELARAAAGAVIDTPAADVSFVSSVAEGVSMLVESISWEPGDSVLIVADEYPSVVYPFLARFESLSVRPRVVWLSPDDVDSQLEAYAPDSRVRAIAISSVSYRTGERRNLAGLRGAADRLNALLILDHSHAAGVLPIDAEVADFAFIACYKFLLGSTGSAIAYWNRQRQPSWQPTTAGSNSVVFESPPDYGNGLRFEADAYRFTRGNPSHPSIYLLENGLRYLKSCSVDRIADHVEKLSARFLEGLDGLGIASITPRAWARRGPNIAVSTTNGDLVAEQLSRASVLSWNGAGRVRFSFHGYNSGEDVDRALTALESCWSR